MPPQPFDFTLCADDNALSPAVSAGILEAASLGRISASSAMTNRPDWPRAARDWHAAGPNAALGLHLNLTVGAPLSPMPSLAPDGNLPTISHILRLSRQNRLPRAEIAAEISSQIQAFCLHFGQPPEFVDGHQHVQVLPQVRQCLLDELTKRQWQGQLWLRSSADRLPNILARRSAIKKALGLAFLARGFASHARSAGFACNHGFSGFSAFDPAGDYGREFARNLRAPGPRHLIMCHPGHVDAQLRAADTVTETREQELAFLLSGQWLKTLQSRNARLVRTWG